MQHARSSPTNPLSRLRCLPPGLVSPMLAGMLMSGLEFHGPSRNSSPKQRTKWRDRMAGSETRGRVRRLIVHDPKRQASPTRCGVVVMFSGRESNHPSSSRAATIVSKAHWMSINLPVCDAVKSACPALNQWGRLKYPCGKSRKAPLASLRLYICAIDPRLGVIG